MWVIVSVSIQTHAHKRIYIYNIPVFAWRSVCIFPAHECYRTSTNSSCVSFSLEWLTQGVREREKKSQKRKTVTGAWLPISNSSATRRVCFSLRVCSPSLRVKKLLFCKTLRCLLPMFHLPSGEREVYRDLQYRDISFNVLTYLLHIYFFYFDKMY